MIKAILIKPTSFGYHHLALSLKRLLENDKGRLAKQYIEDLDKCQYEMLMRQGENRESMPSHASTIMQRRKAEMRESRDVLDDHLTIKFLQADIKPTNKNKANISFDTKYQRRQHQARYDPDIGRERHERQRSVLQCPKNPTIIHYDGNEDNVILVDKIVKYLDKASEMSSNTIAIYDKAILYRQISRPEKALEVLKHLMRNKEEFSTKVMLANIYEQAANCISDILLDPKNYKSDKVNEMQSNRYF